MGEALTWLAEICPEDAVLLWPALLTPKAGKDDAAKLLSICDARGVEPPVLPKLVTLDMSDDVLDLLANSRFPEARLVVVQALAERHCKFEDLPPALDKLC